MIYFVGAYANHHVMGSDGHLPWPRMAADIVRLHRLTNDQVVVMGERTYREYQSVKHAFGVAEILVLSRSHDELPDAEVVSVETVLKRSETSELWVIGGASIFKLLIEYADRMYLTEIEGEFEGDVYFPEYSSEEWQLVDAESYPADAQNPYPYSFLLLERIS